MSGIVEWRLSLGIKDIKGTGIKDWRGQLDWMRRNANAGGLAATPYYLSLANMNLDGDPILAQLKMSGDGTALGSEKESSDPLGEDEQSPVPRLVHRYSDRALLLATNRCAVRCAFCLRGRIWRGGGDVSSWMVSESELDDIAKYLEKRRRIREVLISGGDPLVLETSDLRRIITRISRLPNIRVIRVGSRVPVVLPSRVDAELVDCLASFPGLWLATHFNHPRELTKEALGACRALVSRGVPVLNQTVLLKGVNDAPDTLERLFAELAAHRVKPHYLFHVDPARGCARFATGVERGLEIMKALRGRLSSVATPVFAIDLPGGGGKVPLLPDYSRGDGAFEALDGAVIPYPFHGSCFGS